MTDSPSSGGGRGYRPTAPKPYDFVPVAAEVRRAPTVGHEVLLEDHLSGRLEYRLLAQTHLFVSSGTYALSEEIGEAPGDVIRTCYRVVSVGRDGRARAVPAIPGSSLKGAVRAVFEAVTSSCISITRVNRRMLRLQDKRGERCTPDYACPACSVFGTLGRLGKVRFGDALLRSGRLELYKLPNFYRPRLDRWRVPEAYLEGGRLKGRKFYMHGRMVEAEDGAPAEVIAAGGELRASLDFINLTRQELAGLLFALGLDQSFALKLGGGKPACLGAMVTQPLTLTFWKPDALTSYETEPERYEGKSAVEYVRTLVTEMEDSGDYLLSRQMKSVRSVLQPDRDRECPTGPY